MKELAKKKRPPVVHFPSAIESEKFIGKVYGYFHADSNEYNIISYGNLTDRKLPRVGEIATANDQDVRKNELYGIWEGEKLIFKQGDLICRKQPYELLTNIFSRNSGILESDVMLNKSVLISGCGSVGSLVALELARSGVGNFLLVDNDTVAYHNLCRHQCGALDVGKFKVNAVKERILQINPRANVSTQTKILEQVPKATFDEFCKSGTVIIGCADNREGDLYANRISCYYKAPFVSIGFWERAFAGEIFYSIPGKMPCYECPFGSSGHVLSNRTSTNRRFYTTEEDLAQVHFEPGISTDISFVTTIGIKLILDLLNLETSDYIPRLLNHLSQFTLICNTNDTKIGGEQAEIFSYPLQITTSLKVDYIKPCPPCKIM